jgi:hypothetical protein
MLDAPVFDVDDGTLLDGAASVWAVIDYAADLPATPENKAALAQARRVFVDQLAEFGLAPDDLNRYLAGFRTGEPPERRGSPTGA